MPWDHISPIHGHPMEADVDCTGQQFAAKFIVAGDFDGDSLTELAVAPDADGSRGNDFWVMKYNVAGGAWQHMAPIPNHPMEADFDCSGTQFAAKFAVVADFDGDGADEIAIAPDTDGSRGQRLVGDEVQRARSGVWQHMAPIPNHPMDADIDCSGPSLRPSSRSPATSMATAAPSSSIAPDTGTSEATTCG